MKNKNIFRGIDKNAVIVLFFIIILGGARFLYLGSVPGIHEDEALYGIKTYLIMTKDFLTPIGFNFYTGPLIGYIRIPFFYLFGVNVFTLRLPVVILSLIAIFYIYKLLSENYNRRTGIIASVLFLVMPWSFIYSRFSDETHTASIFFAVIGIYYLKRNSKLMDLILGSIFLGLGVFNHIAFIVVILSYIVYLFVINKDNKRKGILKKHIIFFIIFSVFFIARLLIMLKAHFCGEVPTHYDLMKAIDERFFYKLIVSIPHFLKMIDGSIFYQRVTGENLIPVIPFNSLLFLTAFILILRRHKSPHKFFEADRFFMAIFISNFILICLFSEELALRYFLIALTFATILLAIFLGSYSLSNRLRRAVFLSLIILNVFYIGADYFFAFKKSEGKAGVFKAGNYCEYSTNFLNSKPLYDYLIKENITQICTKEKCIKFPLLFFDIMAKKLNIYKAIEDIKSGKIYFVSYKDCPPDMYFSVDRYKVFKMDSNLKNYDIFLIEKNG